MTRDLEDLSIEEVQILEIVREGSTIHRLAILDQMKHYANHGEKEFDIMTIQNLIDGLTNENYLKFIEKIESYSITELGRDLLFS
jgi:aromatic ring-opening dioxygenase catalytic subunit (LigB family)